MVRIDPNVPIANSGQPERAAETQSAGSTRTIDPAGGRLDVGRAAGADSASISQLAMQLGNFPASRTAQVQALRRAVRSGSYAVDAEKVAQSMLREWFGIGQQP